jgi:hypothetical protein
MLMNMDISWDQAIAWRMRRHYFIERASPKQLVAVVDRLRGLHAQVMSSVDLALWARIEGLRREHVVGALWKNRTLVKMWAMRATLHVLQAACPGTYIAGARIWKPGGWPLKDSEALPVADCIDKALRGKALDRTELAEAITKLGGLTQTRERDARQLELLTQVRIVHRHAMFRADRWGERALHASGDVASQAACGGRHRRGVQ